MEKLRNVVNKYVDSSCSSSYMVFVDGIYSNNLSNVQNSGIPDSVMFKALTDSDCSFDEDTLQSILEQMSVNIPDVNEKPRDSFSSDLITGINLVIKFY